MMHLLKGCVIAFSMYSKIPMPHLEWKEEDMKYMICFFPLVGPVIGLLAYLWIFICGAISIGAFARIAVLSVLPVLISGGIHVDGFMDTMDAVHSHREKERKLEILKDSHIGAFAVIMLAVYGLLYLAALSEISDKKMVVIFCLGFFLSRTMSAFALATMKNARGSGTAYTFAKGAALKKTRAVLMIYATFALAIMTFVYPPAGAAMTAITVLWYLGFNFFSNRNFGGITGDMLGYYLMISELLTAAVAAVFSIAFRLI